MRSILFLVLAACSSSDGQDTDSGQDTDAGVDFAPCGHAHNDYLHDRPLLDALERGFCSVEADVLLVEGALLVAHELSSTDPERTLQSLYLDPLAEIVARDGRAWAGPGPLQLLIDVKSDATETWPVIEAALADHTGMLTRFEGGQATDGAVTVVISGNRDREAMAAAAVRYAAVDGRLADLDAAPAVDFVPLISDNIATNFAWFGPDPMTDTTRQAVRAEVDRAHAQGRRIRFWSIPDTAVGWTEMVDLGVDYVNTDDLDGLAAFLE